MKKSIHKIICLALTVSGLSFYACQNEEFATERQQAATIVEKSEARTNDGILRCNVTTTAAGQVDSLITVLATKGDYPREGITHLTISGPINKNDLKTMCNFQYLDSLNLSSAEITELASYSFQNFKSKAHIILPKTLKTIKEYAFHYGNEKTIKSVYIQDSVKTIGHDAFNDCGAMESVRLPQNLTELPYRLFYGCGSLKEVVIPKYVKEIGNEVFQGCSSLKNVEIPKQVTEIGTDVFNGCSSLDSIQWPSYQRYIPNGCFENCSNLVFEIPEYIESIGNYAFSGCKKITKYEIPASVESIGEFAFEKTGITTLTITNETMVAIGLFKGSAISSLTISEGVTSLPKSIFQDCDNLKSIKFPSSMKTIGNSAFEGCDNLNNIIFNENLESIGSSAFQSNKSLQNVTIPATVIYGYAFAYCDKLEKIVFKEDVETIGDNAFRGVPLLKNVTIPAKTIGDYAFYDNDNLKQVVFGSKLESIGNSAFYSCDGITEVEWNEGLKTIGSYAFAGANFKSFTAPSTLQSIGNDAFYTCESLTKVTLNEGLTSIGGDAFRETSIETITIPSTLEKCGSTPFQSCRKLTSVFWKSSIEAPNLSGNYDDSTNTLLYLTHGKSSVDNPNRIVNGKSQSIILLRSGGDFHCPESFVSDMQYDRVFNRRYDYVSDNVNTENSYDKNYSFQNRPGQASCWQTIVLPFEVTSIKCGDKELVPFGVEKKGAYPFWLRELTANGFVRATKIEANKPYIIAMPNNEAYADEYNIRGKVSFYAENVTIPVTKELKEVQGPSFNFYPTYTWRSKDSELLVLNRINEYSDWQSGVDYYYGSVFVPNQYDLGSFGAYVSSPAGGRSVVPIESSLSSRRTHKLGPIPQENDM